MLRVYLDSSDPSGLSALVAQLLLIIPLSKTEIAQIVGVSRQQLYRWESGEALPTLVELERLAAIAGEEVTISLNSKGPPLRERVAKNTDAIRFLCDLLESLHADNPDIQRVLKRIREQTNGTDDKKA